MKKALVVFAAVLAACGLWAQEKSPNEAESLVTQAMRAQQTVIRIYQVNPDNRERILKTLQSIVGANVTADAQTNVVVVKTSPDLAPALDELVKRLDVTTPKPENIDLTFYVVQATKEPAADAGPFPPQLQSALNQIHAIFPYRSFRLLDTLFARCLTDRVVDMTGEAALAKDSVASLHVRVEPSDVSPPGRGLTPDNVIPRIRLGNLRFTVSAPMPNGGSRRVGELSADVDFYVTQKVVIGKTGVEGGQSSLILIAAAQIAN